jgi:CHAT domain-containing protein
MKRATRSIAALAALLAAACAGTDVIRSREQTLAAAPVRGPDVNAKSALQKVSQSPVGDGTSPTAPTDTTWIDERWPELAEAEALTASGQFDAARATLTAWAEPGFEALCADLDDEHRVAVAKRVDLLAEPLSHLDVQLVVRESRHEILQRLLPADHPDLLEAKQLLSSTFTDCANPEAALVLDEYVYAVLAQKLPDEHPERLRAELNVAVSRSNVGDRKADAHLEHVHEAMSRVLPDDHPDLLRAKGCLALMHESLGDLALANELLEHVHEARERLLPVDDLGLLWTKWSLARTRKKLGDIAGALQLEEYVHAARERLLPPDHPHLLYSKQFLAITRKELGDTSGALELEEYVHRARERLLPVDHPELLTAKQSLALTLYALGDFEGALVLEEYVHEARQRLLPPEHPELLFAKESLARVRSELGDLAGALELEEYVHTVLERHLPAESLLGVKMNLAVRRKSLGDFAGAQALETYVLAARDRLLPADHPDLLAVKQNLATTRRELGDLAGALALETNVLSALERLLPADHGDLLLAKQNLAVTRQALGDVAGAHVLCEHVHSVRERLLPADHPDLLVAKQNLAVSLEELGDLTGAHALNEYVHAERERLQPPDHPDLLDAKQNLAQTRRVLGDLAGAHALNEYVCRARERLLPPDHPALIAAKQNLAVTRSELGDLAGALELQEHVHAVRERVLTPDHADLLSAKHGLAARRWEHGDISGANMLFEHVHSAFERILPAEHPDLLAAKQTLALTLKELGELERALALEDYVHSVRERLLSAEHPDLLLAKQNLALTLGRLGDLERALLLLEYVHEARERLLPSDHPDLLSSKQNLAVTRGVLGDFEGLHMAATSLLSALQSVACSLSMQSPRFARSVALHESDRLALIASMSDALASAGEAGITPDLVVTLESLRAASTAAPETARAARAAPGLRETLVELARVRRTLANRIQDAPSIEAGFEAFRGDLFRMTEERDRLERSVRITLQELGASVDLPTLASIAGALAPGCAYAGLWRYDRFIESDLGGDSLLAFVVTPDGEVQRIELGPMAPIDEAIAAWRAALGKPLDGRNPVPGFGNAGGQSGDGAPDLNKAGEAIRALILDPILAAVPEGTRELRCVLDDSLFLVPLDALPLDDGIVGERYTIRVGTTALQFEGWGEEAAGEPSLLVVGGVDYAAAGADVEDRAVFVATPVVDAATRAGHGAGFSPLEGAQLEAESVGELFAQWSGVPPATLTGDSATKAALVEQAQGARYLHIATHGWFTPEDQAVSMLDGVGRQSDDLLMAIDRAQDTIVGFLPETLCGLALAGANHGAIGRLTAEELSTLDLSNCELAVLSACETNVGIRRAGQGIQSLQTSLHAAGVRTAITSLWRVSDAATMRLFELFYTKLWKDGLGPGEALWQAKMALREEGYATKDWAGWVLTGDPG